MTQRSFLVPLLATLVLACAEEGVSTTDTTSSGGSNNAGAAGSPGQGGAAGSGAGQGGSQAGSGGDSGTSGQGGESGTSGQAGSSTAGQGGSDAGSGGSSAGAGGSAAGSGGSTAGAGGSDAGAGGSDAGAGGSDAGAGGSDAGAGGSAAGAGGSDAGAGGSGTAGAGGAAGAVCGGKTGKTCEKGSFCNVDGHCGYTDGTGTCEALPEACAEDCPGVCGCDGEFYCNACTAHAQGVSVSESKDCLGAGGSAGSGGSGGSTGAVCGGKTGKTCEKGSFCNVDGHCGYTDGTGTCEALPEACAEDCPGVCGCDGEFYCNACTAHGQGVSVSDSTSCLPAADCSPFAAKLQPEFQMVGACTAVVRLDYTTKAILGYAVRCGKYSLTDEATARKAAVTSTGFGASSKQIAGANPEDEYVFFQPPGDIGDVAAVHRRTGLAVFGGSIIGLGKGDISFPKEWRPASDLGKGCDNATIMVPPARGFDLQDGATLPDKETQAALQVVWKTALPQAMAQANYIFDAMVLLYPRSVFEFDPASAEWIVLLNGGWLD